MRPELYLLPSVVLPYVAMVIGWLFARRSGKPWFHHRVFGAIHLLLSVPALVMFAVFHPELGIEMACVSGAGALASCYALTRTSPEPTSERKWRTLGAWLMALALLAYWCVGCVAIAPILTWPESAPLEIAVFALQLVVIGRMWNQGLQCLRRGMTPVWRPARGSWAALQTALSILLRGLSALLWLALSAMLFVFSAEWAFGDDFIFRSWLVPAVCLGAIWAFGSAVMEAWSVPPDHDSSRPEAF